MRMACLPSDGRLWFDLVWSRRERHRGQRALQRSAQLRHLRLPETQYTAYRVPLNTDFPVPQRRPPEQPWVPFP